MLNLIDVHHVAIICSDYERSKKFYTEVLGLEILQEIYRAERDSFKLDLGLNGKYILELFSFPDPPERVSRPEAAGLRHLAFSVLDLEKSMFELSTFGVSAEPIRVDDTTGNRFTFFEDPDGLPIEFYES
jgi:glyoxylase I family protein